MNTGTKTQAPVDYDTAKSIYDKLVREKMAKGYTEGPDGTRIRIPQRKIASPVCFLNLSTRLTKRKSNGCSKIHLGRCRKSQTAAVSWSVRLAPKFTASIARAC